FRCAVFEWALQSRLLGRGDDAEHRAWSVQGQRDASVGGSLADVYPVRTVESPALDLIKRVTPGPTERGTAVTQQRNTQPHRKANRGRSAFGERPIRSG